MKTGGWAGAETGGSCLFGFIVYMCWLPLILMLLSYNSVLLKF